MKLLFDQNLSYKLCQRLADTFPNSDQVGRLSLSQASDRALWEFAKTNGFALVSQDADFAELAALIGPPPKVIWLRGGNRRTSAVEHTVRRHALAIAAFDADASAACLELY